MDEPLRRACDLPIDDAAFFDDNSARLNEGGEELLGRVAACMKADRFADRRIEVIGFTDPRGSARYNRALGLYRAWAAKLDLVRRGVEENKIIVSSRGEAQATGDDPESWARERRVEVHLAAGPPYDRGGPPPERAAPSTQPASQPTELGGGRSDVERPREPWDTPPIIGPAPRR